MSSADKINLLPRDDFEYSPAGKLVGWAVSVGRWIVVLTEFVVICAFLSRFYFDTQLANLFDEIKQKKAIVASAANFEDNFRQIQERTNTVKNLLAQEKNPSSIITEVSNLLPIEVTLNKISIADDELKITGYSFTESGLKYFMAGLVDHPNIKQVSLDEVSSRKEGLPGISFNITATLSYK
ncbi:PilN domain-containing protein [Patescibacteria group bacterium]|nr:PilN domain-containing protein [Patescibacteria group bacterium]